MEKKKQLVLCLDGSIVLAALVAGPVARAMLRWLPDCFVAALGFQCPACGGTRCVQALLGGRFGEAFGLNPYFFVTAIYLVLVLALLNIWCFQRGDGALRLLRKLICPKAVILWAVGFLAFGILRNIPAING